MTEPPFSKSPRDPDYIPKIIGHCRRCREELSPDWELWTDDDNNLFCCEECAIAYHDIHEVADPYIFLEDYA